VRECVLATPCTSHSLTSAVDPPNPAVCLVQVPLKKGFSLMNWIDKTNKMGGGNGGNKRPAPVTNASAYIPNASSSPRATHRNPQRQHRITAQHNTSQRITSYCIASHHFNIASHHIHPSQQVGSVTRLDMSSRTHFTYTSPLPELTASLQVGITPLDMSSLAQFTCMNI
jgi:hypothetical protein